ncbi:hypothetical protein [Undibacterium sp. TJN19]|uniref:hypothetical protein n=1 Tax=Undibacterium sp. TJN19 TaxID=3413055 RepID=UPI003BF38735
MRININRISIYFQLLVSFVLPMPAIAAIYVSPEKGPVAEITLENRLNSGMDFVIYADAKECKGRSFVQRPADRFRTAKIPASTLLAVTIGQSVETIGCPITFQFTPEIGASYLIIYEKQHEGSYSRGGQASCQLNLKRIETDRTFSIVDDVEQRKMRAPFFESGAWCEPKK